MLQLITGYYNENVTVWRNYPTVNDFGDYADSWQEYLEDVPARIRPLNGSERLLADKDTLYASHRMYCGIEDILERDEIEDESGNRYRVVFVSNVMNWNNHLQIDMELVR